MNYSIYSADRATHLKIVVVALIAGIAMAGFALLSHTSFDVASTQSSAVIKAGKPIAMSSSDRLVTR